MSEPFFFGESTRALFGMLHPGQGRAETGHRNRPACLICPPLLQEAMRTHRAMWQLAEKLSDAGYDVLRFDWFASGDSAGDCSDLSAEHMIDDVGMALHELSLVSGAEPTLVRVLALRAAALPVLAHAASAGTPLDLVLWDPVLDGAALVEDWRRQQVEQLSVAGRYPYGAPESRHGDLMGFDVPDAFLEGLQAIDHAKVELPKGSRVLLAAWRNTSPIEEFVEFQRSRGIQMDCLWLDEAEAPVVDQPRQFEAQVLPRRSIARIAGQMTGVAA